MREASLREVRGCEAALVGRKFGIPARDLRDANLERELRHLWRTREDTVLHGTAHAIRAHTDRMMQLEHEYIARFPRKTRPTPHGLAAVLVLALRLYLCQS